MISEKYNVSSQKGENKNHKSIHLEMILVSCNMILKKIAILRGIIL